MLHIAADAPPPSWVRVEVRTLTSTSLHKLHEYDCAQNTRSIQKVVTLLIPGLTPERLSLPSLPTSATINPNVPLQIPLLSDSEPQCGVPFIAKTFSYACPTRAPGDQTRMHSVLGAFFQSPVSGEEKKRRILDRVTCMSSHTNLLCLS